MIRGGPSYLTLWAMVLLGIIAVIHASRNWRGKTREEQEKVVEKMTK